MPHTVYALDPYAPLSPQIPTPAPSSSANAAAIAASSVVSTSICVSKLVEFDGARDGARWRVSKEEKQRARHFGGLFWGAPRAASYS